MSQYVFNINHRPFGSGAVWDEKTAILNNFYESETFVAWLEWALLQHFGAILCLSL